MMTRTDFIEKLASTGIFAMEEIMALADASDDYEALCNMMYFSSEDLDEFNRMTGLDFSQSRMDDFNDIMDSEW